MDNNIIGVEGASPSQYLVQQALHDYQNTIQRLTVSQVRQHEILAVIDTREQNPLDLEKYGIKSERGTLPFGDYSLRWPDLRGALVLERKSLDDFTACCGRERDRFEKEIRALRGYKYKAIVCEFNMSNVICHDYRSQINPDSVVGSIARWMADGIPFIMAESHDMAAYLVAKFLRLVAKDVIAFARKCVE